MKLFNLLLKIWAIPFYRSNAGFFLFFFFLFFGTVSPGSLVTYHFSLIQSILSSNIILAGVLFLWTCYNHKCTQFIFNSITKEEGNFLYQFQALPFKKQIVLLSLIELFLFFPILSYITIVVVIALHQNQLLQASILILFALSICSISSIYYSNLINKTWIYKKPLLAFNFFKITKPKHFHFLLLRLSFQKKKKQLLVLKLISLIAFYIALVWNGDRYDHDSLVLFLLLIIITHAALAFQFVRFIELSLQFFRNLPIQPIRIFLMYYITFIVLLLPELLYLILAGYPLLGIQQILAVYFTLVHTLLLFTTVQYSGIIDRNEFVKIIFGVSFVSIFFFNSEQYTWWATLTIFIALLLFFTSYSLYEPPLDT